MGHGDTRTQIERCLSCTRAQCTGSCEAIHAEAQAAARPERRGRAGRRYEYQGQAHTATEWARLKGLPDTIVRRRLLRGWSIRDALESPVGTAHGKRRRLLTARGKEMGLTEWAAELGVNKGALYEYLKLHGGNMEQAVAYYELRREARARAQTSGEAAKGRNQSGEV